jgi:uncharacterized protein (TIGR02145 family)
MKTKITPFAILLMSTLAVQAQTIMNIHQSNGTVLQIPLNTIDSITYTINNPGNLASITTLPIDNITSTSATSGGNITNNGGTPVTQRGIVWGTSPNPTTASNSTNDGSGTGNFTSNLSGLTANTTYYVRAYATNSAGTSYGNEVSFTASLEIVTNPGSGVTFDGYTYASVILGNGQEWMAENLRTNIFSNGDTIPNVILDSDWAFQTSTSGGAWAHYNNDSQYDDPYGKLYNWMTVTDWRNLCPLGWHVPSDWEWTVLTDYLGGETGAGSKMKSTGIQFWSSPNQDATNESGFSGLPGGVRQATTNGSFGGIGISGHWWSSTQYDPNTISAYSRSLSYNSAIVNNNISPKRNGFSVRCLKD